MLLFIMGKRQWFRVQLSEDQTVADLHIFDLIGDWFDDLWGSDGIVTTAKSFQRTLDELPDAVKTIRLHVNSPGGDVFSAVTIANLLRAQRTDKGRTVETLVEGLAASAASVIIQAGDPIRMGDNALVMIHNPWSIAIGEANNFRARADELDTVRDTLIATYRWHSQLEPAAIAALMDATTWMDADDAIANGFATEKVEGLRAAAALDPRGLARLSVPDKFRARVDALLAKPAPAADVLRACREADCLDLAEALIRDQATVEQVAARVGTARAERQTAQTREQTIVAVCTSAALPELAAGYVRSGMAVAEVKAHLTTIAARLDAVEIDSALDPDHGVAEGREGWKRAFSRAVLPFGRRTPQQQGSVKR